MAASTFFWQDGRYGLTGGVLVALSAIAWVYGLLAIWEWLYASYPRLAACGVVVSLLGCFGGIAFGLQGFFEGMFGVSHEASLAATAAHPVAANVVLWIPGPAFPLSLMLMGVLLARVRAVPTCVAVALAVSGLVFPLSRIPRVELIAHAADLLMLVPSCYLAVLFTRGRLRREGGNAVR